MPLTRINLIIAIFWVSICNLSFFRHVIEVYPINTQNLAFLLSLSIGLTSFIFLFLTLITTRLSYKISLSILLLTTAVTTYFMDNYNVVIDHSMIRNIIETNYHESLDHFNVKLLFYFILLGVLPSVFLWRTQVTILPWRRATLSKARDAVIATVLILGIVLLFSRFYASFFREHKPLRYYTNPTYLIYSIGKYINKHTTRKPTVVQSLGTDARIPLTDIDRELVILVIGESARADHFSLNGYQHSTNPRMKDNEAISFSQMYSCGTSTAYSLPCMFSNLSQEQFSEQSGAANENLLDVLQHAGVHVLWRDNNSDSKGVALRVPYAEYKKPSTNPVCDVECRDEGMLHGLQEYIDAQNTGDITIVLHQMGNHGPAYYKRYPQNFEQFTPTCQTNQLEQCSKEAINNTYDNAILYTDYFLDKVIALLRKNDDRFETAMFYMSDHGESLGEFGVYLHGLPYGMAPESQKHVASILWFGKRFAIDREAVARKTNQPFTHDNFFHTVLGLMEIESATYNKNLDILSDCKPAQ